MLSEESNPSHRGLRTLPTIGVNSGLDRSLVAALCRDDMMTQSKYTGRDARRHRKTRYRNQGRHAGLPLP
ncbi:MAG: hypothetical protein M1511_18385 [Deltaproteobacteria bacterium]|nr:hypothetical protein [Deltaproteobacteria bacterium]